MKILILGHTGHIGRGLFEELSKEHDIDGHSLSEPFPLWNTCKYDVLINCIGVGTPKRTAETGYNIIEPTLAIDKMVLQYLESSPDTMYVYLSSGIADERYFDMSPYAISKLTTEMIHRAYSDKWIIDLRIYSYLSEYIDLDSGYLITEMIKCVLSGEEFLPKDKGMVRDYIGKEEIAECIKNLYLYNRGLNRALNIGSSMPILMKELLQIFKYRYDLKYVMPEFESTDKRSKYSPKYTDNHPLYRSDNLIIKVCDKIIARECAKQGHN